MMALPDSLRYIDASNVDTPAGRLQSIDVVGPTDDPVGKLDGVVFDPFERQVRFFVVESRRLLRARHFLVPVTPARFDAEHRTLQVELDRDGLDSMEQVNPAAFPPFSDDDLVEAVFSSRS
jgi:PRC-barrel domain